MGLRHYTRVICALWIFSLCSAGENDDTTKITHLIGQLSPPHDLLLEYGNDPLNSTCTITNSSVPVTRKNRISFKLGKIPINDSMVERLDNRSARVVILKPEMTKSTTFLTCELDDKIVDVKYLVVGTKPQDIQDFKCIGYNFANMTCTWKREMTTNYNVNYSLWYRFKHVPGNFSCQNLEKTEIDGIEIMSCFWNMSTTPQIRLSHNHIYFTITGSNEKGSITRAFHIEQKEIMKSEAPINLTVLRVKARSMMLHWQIPFDVTMMKRSIQYRVMVTCEYWNMTSFKQVAVFSRNSSESHIKYNLTDLPYAHTLYDIRVGIKISKYDTEEMWSANSSVTNYTANLIPASAPAASPTGFYFTNGTGFVTIYWTQLDKRFRNGPEFEYVITPYLNDTAVKLTELKRGSAHVQYDINTNILDSTPFKFKIESKNSVGKSKNASYVFVPPKGRVTMVMNQPVQTVYSSVLYQLSWEPPKVDADLVTNYTVYWCIAQKDPASHSCEGILQFETVPKTTLRYNVTIPNNTNVQLAISANGENQSTGLVWPECTIHISTVQHEIKKVSVERVTSTSITLRWQVLCEHKTGNIKGYFIEYCPTNSTGLECVAEDMRNYTLDGANHGTVTIPGLEPYTSYQLRVYTKDASGSFSQSSEWVANTTYDAAPTAPYGLNITGTSNTTISIEWFEPLKKNGIISNYKIYYNERQDTINISVDTTQLVAKKHSFNLTGLISYHNYTIAVAACVRDMCSDRSNTVIGWTHVGAPGFITDFNFTAEDKTLSWPPPSNKGGKIDYYEVKLRRSGEDDDQAVIKRANGSSYKLVQCEDGRIFYQVRAVNEMGDQQFYGKWSAEKSENCHVKIKSISPALVVSFVIILGLIIIGFAVVMYKFLIRYFRRMKDVQYVVPNGLNGKSPPKKQRPPSSDPQCLLDPKEPDHDLHHNGSSGFNSAHESSSESGESISSRTTDSGTGQRSTDNDFPMQHLKDIDTYQPLSKSSSGGNYVTVFGVKPEAETKNGALSDNVPLDDRSQITSKINLGEEQPPPVKKPVNTGYTPVEPTPSYVMAMPPCTESKGYVPSAELHKFMEPIVLPSFRMSLPSTTFTNDNGNDKGYVHATYDGDITSNFNSPKDTPPQVFKVSPGYVSCADSTRQPVVPEEPTSSAYVMHKQLEHVLPNN